MMRFKYEFLFKQIKLERINHYFVKSKQILNLYNDTALVIPMFLKNFNPQVPYIQVKSKHKKDKKRKTKNKEQKKKKKKKKKEKKNIMSIIQQTST